MGSPITIQHVLEEATAHGVGVEAVAGLGEGGQHLLGGRHGELALAVYEVWVVVDVDEGGDGSLGVGELFEGVADEADRLR